MGGCSTRRLPKTMSNRNRSEGDFGVIPQGRRACITVASQMPTRYPCPSSRYTDHMAKQVTATDAKATILRLLDDAAAGEEIEITRHGRPVARLVPASGARSLKGSFEGVAMTAVDEEQLFSTGERWNAA